MYNKASKNNVPQDTTLKQNILPYGSIHHDTTQHITIQGTAPYRTTRYLANIIAYYIAYNIAFLPKETSIEFPACLSKCL